MNRWKSLILLAGALLLVSGAAWAQGGGEERQYYLDEDLEEKEGRFALGLGFGLVDLGDDLIIGNQLIEDDDVEQYYAVNFRIGFGQRRAHRGPRHSGFRGYFEPELGYWESDSRSDMLLGVNLIGTMPVNAVEFFVGGGIGVHFIDTDIEISSGGVNVDIDDSDEALGVNAQFGIDISISDNVSLFGVGRFDLVDDERDDLESKAYVGLRIRFGGDGD